MNKLKILLAEDDINLGILLKEYLQIKNYVTDLYPDGVAALEGYKKNVYDLCILDVMMPHKDGFEVAKSIRKINRSIPIIFLTAKVLKEDVLSGFRVGADDYITKPFNMEELLYRIEAVVRRSGADKKNPESFEIGKLTFQPNAYTIYVTDNPEEKHRLTSKETDLLQLLCLHKEHLVKRKYALKVVWDGDDYFNARSMDVYITKLRKILKMDPRIKILNKHGEGFRLTLQE
ncbi:MAG: DNA-binding response regulator [Bacteroidia bacterium]|nr:MAG: DNA-binding response regulator [Bacteroidia bacterium]